MFDDNRTVLANATIVGESDYIETSFEKVTHDIHTKYQEQGLSFFSKREWCSPEVQEGLGDLGVPENIK